MTVEEIIREINEELTDQGFPAHRMLDLMNRGAKLVARGRFQSIPGEICLEALETVEDISADGSTAYIDLTGLSNTFQKKLVSVYNTTSDGWVKIYHSLTELKDAYVGLDDSGNIQGVARAGTKLYYQGLSADTLRLTFFKEPTTLAKGSTPSFLPDEFQVPILKNYVLMHMPKKYTKTLMYDPRADFNEAIYQLYESVGDYEGSIQLPNDLVTWEFY